MSEWQIPMVSYSLPVAPLSSLTFSGNPPDMQQVWGGGWWSLTWTTPQGSFTWAPTGVQTAEVLDDDGVLQDDPLWGGSSDGESWGPHSQVLSAPLTIGGVTWPAGTVIEDEYEVVVAGPDGTQYVMAFIGMTTPDGASTTIVGYTFDGAAPPPGTQLTVISPKDVQKLDPSKAVVCFAAGTLIDTPSGRRQVEALRPGDMVMTRDHGPQVLRWIGSRRLDADTLAENAKLRPICIAAGALGADLPETDLIVSPQHRVLISSRIAERMFGESDVLVAAHSLTGLAGVAPLQDLAGITYFHLLFEQHELIFANGAVAESLYTGPEAMKSLSEAARAEILMIFPELADPDFLPEPALPVVRGHKARQLASRHSRNAQPLQPHPLHH